jgi:hypothetical protein
MILVSPWAVKHATAHLVAEKHACERGTTRSRIGAGTLSQATFSVSAQDCAALPVPTCDSLNPVFTHSLYASGEDCSRISVPGQGKASGKTDG